MHGQWKLELGYRPVAGAAQGLIFCQMISYQGEVVASLRIHSRFRFWLQELESTEEYKSGNKITRNQ